RRSCQTMAGWIGVPVAASQTMVVSRWLVMPMAHTSSAFRPLLARAWRHTSRVLSQISSASCSTQPSLGKYCLNSRWALASGRPWALKTMARELVVPWSMASRYWDMRVSLLLWVGPRSGAGSFPADGGEAAAGVLGQHLGAQLHLQATPPGADVDGRMLPGTLVDEGAQALLLPQRADAADQIAGAALGQLRVGHVGLLGPGGVGQGLEIEAAGHR